MTCSYYTSDNRNRRSCRQAAAACGNRLSCGRGVWLPHGIRAPERLRRLRLARRPANACGYFRLQLRRL